MVNTSRTVTTKWIQALMLGDLLHTFAQCVVCFFVRFLNVIEFTVPLLPSSAPCPWKAGKKLNVFGTFCVDLLAPVQGISFCPWPTDAGTVLQSKLATEKRKGWEREASKSVVDHHSSLNRNLYSFSLPRNGKIWSWLRMREYRLELAFVSGDQNFKRECNYQWRGND